MLYLVRDVVLIVLVSLGNFFLAVPFLFAIICKRWQYLHDRVTSDIPGNPHAFDDCVISLFRTLPEPSNFNVVWTSIDLTRSPIRIKGSKPSSRLNSINIYNSTNLQDIPISYNLDDVKLNECNQFDLILVQNAKQAELIRSSLTQSQSILVCNDWTRCMIAMRNYLVPNGTLVITPEITEISNGKVIRRSETLVSGPAGLQISQSKNWIKYLQQAVLFNVLISLALHFVLSLSVSQTFNVMGISLILAFSYRQVCFLLGKRTLDQLTSRMSKAKNQFVYPSLKDSSKASQPSLLHKYWIMKYDTSTLEQGHLIKITGKICSTNQRYWSVVVYDLYGLPIPQYVYDGNISLSCLSYSESSESKDSTTYDYDIRLSSSGSENSDDYVAIDVSKNPQGYVLFRIVHPKDDSVVPFSHPKAIIVSKDEDSKKKKKKQ